MKISGNLFSECPDHRSYHTFSDSGVALRTAMELVAIKRIQAKILYIFSRIMLPPLFGNMTVRSHTAAVHSNHPAGCIHLILGILLVHSILLCAKDTPCPAVDPALMPEITDCHIICLRHSLDRI